MTYQNLTYTDRDTGEVITHSLDLNVHTRPFPQNTLSFNDFIDGSIQALISKSNDEFTSTQDTPKQAVNSVNNAIVESQHLNTLRENQDAVTRQYAKQNISTTKMYVFRQDVICLR